MRSLRLLAALLALILVGVAAPAVAATPTVRVGFDGDPAITSVSAYRFVGVPIRATGLTGTSVELTLDGTTVRTLTVAPDGTAGADVTFPTIGVGARTLGLRQGSDTVATRKISVQGDPFETVPQPLWITAEKLRDNGVRIYGERMGSRANFVASVGTLAREAQADVNGVLSFVLKDADGDLSKPGDYRAGVYEQGGDPNRVSYRNLRVTVLGVALKERGSVVQGTGFAPGQPVDLLIGGDVRGTGVPNADGTVRIDSPITGSADVTLRSVTGEVTQRLALVRAADLPSGPTDAEIEEAERIAQAASEVQVTASKVRFLVEQAAPTSGPTTVNTPRPIIVSVTAALDQQTEALRTLLGSSYSTLAQGGTTQVGGTIPIASGGTLAVPSFPSPDATAAAQRALAEAQARLQALPSDQQRQNTEALLAQVAQAMRDSEATSSGQKIPATEQNKTKAVIRSSTPELLPNAIDGRGFATVPIPRSFSGLHHVGIVDRATGIVTVWAPVQVQAADADAGTGAGQDTGAALPDAGAPVGPAWPAVGVLAVLLGAALILVERRRRV